MSTFSGLNTALSSLYAQRRALDVTGQNISNANTIGYSRQRADLQSVNGNTVPAFFSTSRGVGDGVTADTVIRIRDMFLEARGHTENATVSRLTEASTAYTQIQQAFREPGDQGLQAILADMWAGWGDVANQPHDPAARGQVLERLQTVAHGLRTSAASLDQQWTEARQGLDTLVSAVNTSAKAVAELNHAIRRAEQAGLPANELHDKRDVLIMDLAKQVGATTRPGEDGILNVYVGGTPLVYGTEATQLQVTGAVGSEDALTSPVTITTVGGTAPVRVGGTASARLETLTSTVPTFQSRLDQIAADLAASLNTAHTSGYDLDGNPGQPLLTTDTGLGAITAKNITVAITDPRQVAASLVAPSPPPAEPTFDGTNADKIAQLANLSAGATNNYRQLIVDLGVQAQSVDRTLAIQEVIAAQVDASRESIAGVNLDEEMANMVAFQHAYEAAGRMVTAIDEMLDILINRTGIVGR